MNPTLIEYFAAHETLSEFDHPESSVNLKFCQSLAGPKPVVGNWETQPIWEWEAKWRAKLRFIRAKAMVEEAERIRTTESTRQSDGPQKTTGLSFSEALEAMKSNKSVRRKEWVAVSIALVNDRFKDSLNSGWGGLICAEDILANDWEIVE